MTKTQEELMFGCSVEQVRQMFQSTMDRGGPSMTVVSMLSDIQELLAHVSDGDCSPYARERLELARQYINQVKFGIMEYLRNS